MEKSDLSKRLIEAMKAKGLSQVELATAAKVSKACINNFIRHQRQPSRETVRKLAGVLNVSVDFLLGTSSGTNVEDLIHHDRVRTLVEKFIQLSPEDQGRVELVIDMLIQAKAKQDA